VSSATAYIYIGVRREAIARHCRQTRYCVTMGHVTISTALAVAILSAFSAKSLRHVCCTAVPGNAKAKEMLAMPNQTGMRRCW